MSKIRRLTCPATKAECTIDLDSMTPDDLVRWVASQLGLAYNEVGDKAMLDLPRPKTTAPTKPATSKLAEIPDSLPVPYYYQFDSATAEGHRMCNSSTNAMVVKYDKPGALSDSPNADDEYLGRVKKYGDTTDHSAQLKALAHFGIHPQFRKDLTWDQVDAQLRRRKPVPIAIYHKGPISAPYGGHCLLVIGKVGNGYRVHDPAGELDLVNGGYPSGRSGKGVIYSKANLDKRWRVGGEAWGYLLP